MNITDNEDDLVSHYFSDNKKKYGLLHFLSSIKELVWTPQNKQFWIKHLWLYMYNIVVHFWCS